MAPPHTGGSGAGINAAIRSRRSRDSRARRTRGGLVLVRRGCWTLSNNLERNRFIVTPLAAAAAGPKIIARLLIAGAASDAHAFRFFFCAPSKRDHCALLRSVANLNTLREAAHRPDGGTSMNA